jgi:hypothetical protein
VLLHIKVNMVPLRLRDNTELLHLKVSMAHHNSMVGTADRRPNLLSAMVPNKLPTSTQ